MLALTACTTQGRQDTVQGAPFHWSQVVQSDVDRVAEICLQQSRGHLETLMVKLYRRNPKQWQYGNQPSLEAAVHRVFNPRQDNWSYPEFEGRRGTDAIRLAFDDSYRGDRVLALIAGLGGMLRDAYAGETGFAVADDLDPQRVYNAARNVETAVWLLSTKRGTDDRLYLISNTMDGSVANLSFERHFGKIIALQDLLALVVAEKTNRTIKRIIRTVGTMVFLPI